MVQVQALAPCVVCCSQTAPASTAVLWHKGTGTRSSSIQTLLACNTFVAPVMTLDTCGFLMHHASASCRGRAQGVHTTPTHGAAARTVQPDGSTLRAHASPARQENGGQGSQRKAPCSHCQPPAALTCAIEQPSSSASGRRPSAMSISCRFSTSFESARCCSSAMQMRRAADWPRQAGCLRWQEHGHGNAAEDRRQAGRPTNQGRQRGLG